MPASLPPSPSYRRRRRTRNQLGRMRSRLSLDRSIESKGGHVTPLHPLFFLSGSAQSMNDKSSPEKERHLINYRLQHFFVFTGIKFGGRNIFIFFFPLTLEKERNTLLILS